MVTPEQLVARQNSARAAMTKLRGLSRANLDALIVLGDDQNESYLDDCRPAIASLLRRDDPERQQAARHLFALPEWYIKNRSGFFEPEKARDYPVHSALACT